MKKHTCAFRVLYADVDRMGVMHHSQYIKYFEYARTEMLRDCGITYKSLEEKGIIMPVTRLGIKYVKPAFYDDLLTVQTLVREMKGPRVCFEYRIYNDTGQLLTIAETILVFIDAKTQRPCPPPGYLLQALQD